MCGPICRKLNSATKIVKQTVSACFSNISAPFCTGFKLNQFLSTPSNTPPRSGFLVSLVKRWSELWTLYPDMQSQMQYLSHRCLIYIYQCNPMYTNLSIYICISLYNQISYRNAYEDLWRPPNSHRSFVLEWGQTWRTSVEMFSPHATCRFFFFHVVSPCIQSTTWGCLLISHVVSLHFISSYRWTGLHHARHTWSPV